jgi:hypothetical protein
VGISFFAIAVGGCSRATDPGSSPYVPAGATRLGVPRDTSSQDLLYISEYGGEVLDVFTWPQAQYLSSISSLNSAPPMGLCVDKKGDVWVVENGEHPQAQEFSHNGASIGDLNDEGEDPYGCAVDPTSGDFAMTSEEGVYAQPSSVEVWKKATGTATDYTDRAIALMLWCGYDDKGDLFVDGLPTRGKSEFALAELPKGGTGLINIKTKGIAFPGAIQWVHGVLTVGDPAYKTASAIHQLQITGTKATSVGLTVLKESYEVFEGWIEGGTVIGPDDGPSISTVLVWNYPAGGKPTQTLSKGSSMYFDGPFGAAVSLAK